MIEKFVKKVVQVVQVVLAFDNKGKVAWTTYGQPPEFCSIF